MSDRTPPPDDPMPAPCERPTWRRCFGRLRAPGLLSRYPGRIVRGTILLVNTFLTIALLASLAMVSGSPLIFPSLGPTALLLFHDPLQPAASPRNTICGHAIGILCGYGSLVLVGLANHPSAMTEGVHVARVFAAALSLAATGAVMVLTGMWHPPAGATTLIIALGIITQPYHLLIVAAAVVLLVLQTLVINRLAGIKYPLWTRDRMASRDESPEAEPGANSEPAHR